MHDYLRSVLPQLAAAPPDQQATLTATLTPQKWKNQLPAIEAADTVC